MAKKPSITTISSGYQTTDTINTNFDNVKNAFDNTLSRDGSTPNSMAADFDMDGNDILNVGNIYVDNIIYEGALPILNGGTGATTASGARDNLGLGTAATKNTSYFTLANYTASGTGAVSRPVTDKLAETISVLDYGAVGDGNANDSAAINAAALAASGKKLYIPAGTYKVKAIIINANTTVECDSNTVFVPWDTTDKTGNNFIIRLNGDYISWSGGKILGEVYSALGDNPSPYYGMVIRKLYGDMHPVGVKLRNFETVGGMQGIWCISTDELTVENVTVRYPYQWGLSFPAPRTKRLILNNVRVYNSGINEGLKISSLYQSTSAGDSTSEIILNNLHIEDCGALNPDVTQNGVDLFISAAQRLSLTNFNIRNSGANGIELKRSNAPLVSPNTYQNVLIQNGLISCNKNYSGGITLNITAGASGEYPSSALEQGKVLIQNIQFNYEGPANPIGVEAINMSAWSDVFISGCQFNGGFNAYINPSTDAALTDRNITRLVVSNCVGYGGDTAIYVGSSLLDCRIINNIFETTDDLIVFAAGSTSNRVLIKDNYFKAPNTGSFGIYNLAATVDNLLVENNTIISDSYPVSSRGTGAIIRDNNLKSSTTEAFRLYDGSAVFHNNNLEILSSKKSYLIVAGTVVSYKNALGARSTIPTQAGEVGDIVYNSAPTSGGYTGWICTTGGVSGSAVWKAFGAIL